MPGLFGFWMPGWQELLIIAFIAVLLFGHRLPKVMGDLGGSMKAFRRGLSESDAEQDIEST